MAILDERIANGAPNMLSFAWILSADEPEQLVAFLASSSGAFWRTRGECTLDGNRQLP